MEDQARRGLAKAREIADLPVPSSKRCRLITTATTAANILMGVKTVMNQDPSRKVVIQPQADYIRLWAQVNRLEAEYKIMYGKLQRAKDEIDDLTHVNAEYVDAEPEVKASDLSQVLEQVPVSTTIERSDADAEYEMDTISESVPPTPFAAHLLTCAKCQSDPLHPCPIGAILLRKMVSHA